MDDGVGMCTLPVSSHTAYTSIAINLGPFGEEAPVSCSWTLESPLNRRQRMKARI